MSSLQSPDGLPRDHSAEELRLAQEVITRTVLAVIDRYFNYPSPSQNPKQLAQSLQQMNPISFGMKKVSLEIKMSGHNRNEYVAAVGLTLIRPDDQEPVLLQVYCPLFPDKTSAEKEPYVCVEGKFINTHDRGPGKAEYALSLLKEAADMMHNLHIADTVSDRAETDQTLAPIQKALLEINRWLRETLEEGNE